MQAIQEENKHCMSQAAIHLALQMPMLVHLTLRNASNNSDVINTDIIIYVSASLQLLHLKKIVIGHIAN